jgi:hypothetical protein
VNGTGESGDAHRLLGAAVPEPPPPSRAVLAADLLRGRRALRRRRAATAAVVALGLALGAGALALPQVAGPGEPPARTVLAGRSGDGTGIVGPATPLVPWTGPRTGAITTALVPRGWEVQGGGASTLVIAPVDATDRDPASYEGKIVVLLEGDAALEEPNAEVDGRPAVLVRDEPSGYAHVVVPDARWAVHVQVPPTTGGGWSDAELLELAAGIEVSADAEPGSG